MDESIALLNIQHFRKLLESETDPAKRATIRHLLAEEEERLAASRANKQRLRPKP
ncbi:hypothetical protein [Jiella sp. M17.18]|uniref:hypothetical protein n=1 Tax=Jiella sp. M17.18 TaxID=3234247 RepID=UPI0034DE1B1E